jgi:hypothetical protein
VSRKAYEKTPEAERNLAVLLAVVVNEGWRPERPTVQWQTRLAVARRRGNAPVCMADAAVSAARSYVFVL